MNPEELKRLLDAATPGPWAVDGPPDNQIIWNGRNIRVAFMAHSGGSDVERDKATAALIVHLVNNAPAILALVEENARLRGHTKAMIHLCQDAGVVDDLVAQFFPDAKRKNGQPASDFAKRARRTINEAKAALGEPK